MSNERRRKKFINSWAQLSIAVEVVLHSLLLLSLISLLLFAPPFVTMMSHYSVADHQAVARDLWEMNISKWPLFLVLAVFVGFISVLFSHHIVGPGYKFEHILHELNERNLAQTVILRKWDYLVEVQGELNRHILQLREDLGKIRECSGNSLEVLADLRPKVSTEAAQQLEKQLSEISHILKAYRGIE